ncbi:IclR family transcriptional regulator [Pseudomonas sp. dw_358]|uniref:IclR family transcriptional regulator n=1 Tax=Pseudomonas sp. dw_358 TaxID=2720083 RepID=UPI001BD5E016|nr:IclR family transcriptional regulator [Pseudomonas sp. dw_358]
MNTPATAVDYWVPALQRGLSVLGMFNAQARSLSITHIAERLGISPSACYRILFTLTEMGYLKKAGQLYELGPQVISDGFSYLASRDIVDIAMPHLNALRDRTSLSAHLSIREQTDSLYLCRAFAAQRLSVNIPIGTRLPCHCTAMGRVLLSGLEDAEMAALYQSVRLDGYAPPAPRTMPELTGLINDDRERGWVLHRSDYSTAIAGGLRDHTGRIIAAINASGPDAVMDGEATQGLLIKEVLQTCAQISRELGFKA